MEDKFNLKFVKESIYNILQNPTRENFVDILDNSCGEQDNLDFKEQWIEPQKLAEIILGIANSGGGAIIFGVKENEDGTLTTKGLEKLEDKEKIHSKIQKFLPDTLDFIIGDFNFTDETYTKIEGKLFQILLVNYKELELPYVWTRDSNGAEVGCIFYRRGTKTVKANMQEIDNMLKQRISVTYKEQSSLQLEEHLKQLSTLYKYIKPKTYSFSAFGNLYKNLSSVTNSSITTINTNYPEESYDQFITNMIKNKKIKIEKILDLK